jgi:hypothetical protein
MQIFTRYVTSQSNCVDETKKGERIMKFLACWTEEDFTGSTRLKKIIEAERPEDALTQIKQHIQNHLEKCSLGSSADAGYIEIFTEPKSLIIDATFYDKQHMPYPSLNANQEKAKP